MSDQRLILPALSMTTTLLLTPMMAHAEPTLPGRASPESVTPDGPVNPRSGAPRNWEEPVHDDALYSQVMVDRLEYRSGSGSPDAWLWDAQGWWGNDRNRFVWKTEGEGPVSNGSPESTEFQALYSHLVAPFWSLQTGVRYDVNPDPDRAYGVLGMQGTAPGMIETDVALFASEEGDVSLRGEFEYDMRLTQRLILQPRVEINASLQDVPEYEREQGINSTEAGLRLRYELMREVAPYMGISHERDHDRNESTTSLVAGLRVWY
ncbi:copper resistance protein B [Kushneria avicenniae]|uniref:Copper resistance protein B n=1 Tax=Kushneria avicenniae TaxID=402385 RepID=A0A1I1J7Q3_9GAMM|nr:copper resistance protein B [Kushneria avicenniae]SFC44012.1 copper resistance protein B [Kushneria avicenniae]